MRFGNAKLTDLHWDFPDGELRFTLIFDKIHPVDFDHIRRIVPHREIGHSFETPSFPVETAILYFSERTIKEHGLNPTDDEHWRYKEEMERQKVCEHDWMQHLNDKTKYCCDNCDYRWEGNGQPPVRGLDQKDG